jgi:hypothetical protein
MERLWQILPGAAMAGLGAVLCSQGYRQVRFQAMTMAVFVFAAAGATIGTFLRYPAFSAGLCVAGAILGYALHGVLFHVYVGLAAAMGGAAVGLLLTLLCHYSNPIVLCGCTAAACAVISLLDARIMTIAWTSAAGAALVTQGLYRSIPSLGTLSPPRLTWTLATTFGVLFLAGWAFQSRMTAEQQLSTKILASPETGPAS